MLVPPKNILLMMMYQFPRPHDTGSETAKKTISKGVSSKDDKKNEGGCVYAHLLLKKEIDETSITSIFYKYRLTLYFYIRLHHL